MSYFEGKRCKITKRKHIPGNLFKPSTWEKYETTTKKGTIIQFNDIRKQINCGTSFPIVEYFEVIVQTDEGEVLRLKSDDIRIIEDEK